ncbi:carbamate kinase [Anoxybacter fermentans]|uniref:Carbamate kinase n=1 Tax=Anoxybacter fermentans TaxID=1323375 RepID=A0A3S9T230_9FIRM|nr:carbamate kinase [Anoxybacter fermentans]AZR74590.1 carbamate kinase [Anoxybacter fermentans]
MAKVITVALGGNAINKPGQKGTAEEQFENVRNTTKQIVKMIKKGHKIIITHGNGPQVGSILIQQEAGSDQVPPMTLDICGSQTQGQIGYMIQQSLGNEMKKEGINKTVVSLVTQVIVDRNDEAFQNPRKPVGPFFDEEHAKKMMKEKGETWIEDAGRGWRKVVPSPIPKGIVEIEAIKSLVDAGFIVVASGGGGIPVVINEDGTYTGVEAVIDKDRAGEVLAEEVNADILMILTDVPYAAINYGTPEQKNLEKVKLSEMKRYFAEGHFKAGSMGPKVEAAIKFVENGGEKAIIASLENALEALENDKGTVIIPD